MRNSILVLALACSAGFSSSAMAQGQVYGGIGFGSASTDVPSNALDDGSVITGSSIDDSDTSLSFFIGYEVSKVISIEGGYIDLGEANITGVSDGSGGFWAAGPVGIKLESSALFINVVGKHALNNEFQLLGKAGLYSADVDFSAYDSSGSGGFSESNTGLLLGFGGSYSVAPNIAVRADFTKFMDVGEDSATAEDIDVLGLSVTFKFD